MVTDSSGYISEEMGTFPFGESWYNASGDKLLFTTYERDAESGNDYAMARYHVNRLARFSSPDPLAGSIANPQSLNRYAYAGNMPVSAIDPSGTCVETENQQAPERYDADGHGGHSEDSSMDASPEPQYQHNCVDKGMLGDAVGGGVTGYPIASGSLADIVAFALTPTNSIADWEEHGPKYGNWGALGLLFGFPLSDDPEELPPLQPREFQSLQKVNCFAQLKYRGVNPNGTGFIGHVAIALSGATHAFWFVQDRNGSQYIVSGGPTGPNGNGYLNVNVTWAPANATAAPGPSSGANTLSIGTGNASARTAFSSQGDCDSVDQLLLAAEGFPNSQVPYGPTSGPNSNSAANYLGMAAGFNAPKPPGAYGWNNISPLFSPGP